MTLYEFNKAGYDSLPDMSMEDVQESLRKAFKETYDFHAPGYLMLLNNEKKYYTVFNIESIDFEETLIEELMDIIHYVFNDRIKSIEFTPEKDAIEIWGVYQEDELPSMFLLFEYNWGVITI